MMQNMTPSGGADPVSSMHLMAALAPHGPPLLTCSIHLDKMEMGGAGSAGSQ